MRLARVLESVFAVHHRCDLARVQQWPDLLAQLFGDLGLGQIALRTQGAAGHRQTACHQRGKVHLYLRPAEEGDLHKTAVFGQRLQVAGDVVAADHIKDQVCPALGFQHINEIRVTVVDRGLGPEFGAGVAFAVGPCRRKNPCAEFAR